MTWDSLKELSFFVLCKNVKLILKMFQWPIYLVHKIIMRLSCPTLQASISVDSSFENCYWPILCLTQKCSYIVYMFDDLAWSMAFKQICWYNTEVFIDPRFYRSSLPTYFFTELSQLFVLMQLNNITSLGILCKILLYVIK